MNEHQNDETSSDLPLLARTLEEHSRQKALEILGDPLKRQVLYDLGSDEDTVALAELAERVANPDIRGAASVEGQSSLADDTTAERVALKLHHVHLPKLDDYGILKYDRRANTVYAGPSP